MLFFQIENRSAEWEMLWTVISTLMSWVWSLQGKFIQHYLGGRILGPGQKGACVCSCRIKDSGSATKFGIHFLVLFYRWSQTADCLSLWKCFITCKNLELIISVCGLLLKRFCAFPATGCCSICLCWLFTAVGCQLCEQWGEIHVSPGHWAMCPWLHLNGLAWCLPWECFIGTVCRVCYLTFFSFLLYVDPQCRGAVDSIERPGWSRSVPLFKFWTGRWLWVHGWCQ